MTQLSVMLIYPLFTGLVLGLLYYGGLWLVLRRLHRLKHPALMMGLSLILRTLSVALILYLLFANVWQQLLIAVLGMLIVRTLLIRYLRPTPDAAKKLTGQAQ